MNTPSIYKQNQAKSKFSTTVKKLKGKLPNGKKFLEILGIAIFLVFFFIISNSLIEYVIAGMILMLYVEVSYLRDVNNEIKEMLDEIKFDTEAIKRRL